VYAREKAFLLILGIMHQFAFWGDFAVKKKKER
jgi:uncharacterized membrane protein YeiB